MKRSLFDKLWDAHVVEELPGGNALVFMDLVVAPASIAMLHNVIRCSMSSARTADPVYSST